MSFAYVEGESLLMALKDIALSSGRSDTNHYSYLIDQKFHFSHTKYAIFSQFPSKYLSNTDVCNILFFSACTSASLEPSYVLRAIGADEDLAHSSIRYSV